MKYPISFINNFFTGLQCQLYYICTLLRHCVQPRPWYTNEAAVLVINKLVNIDCNPFSKLYFELANLDGVLNVVWNAVPLSRSSETVAVLGKCECCVWYYDVSSIIISAEEATQILRFPTLSDPIGTQS